jgi:hypothetical protein
MDAIAGAAILAERFSKLPRAAATPRAATVHPSALPIFHWIGFQPQESPMPQPDEREAHVAPRARLLQLRMKSFAGSRHPRS